MSNSLIKATRLALTSTVILLSSTGVAKTNDWGLGGVVRSASIPYGSALGDTTVTSFSPLFYYEGEYVYADGDEFGVRLLEAEDVTFFAKVETRYVDIPKNIQNKAGGDSGDFGLMAVYPLDKQWDLSASIMWDSDIFAHSQLGLKSTYSFGKWDVTPEFLLRFKSDDFNSKYYAFHEYTGETIGSGVDATASLDARYHVYSNFYLLGGVGITFLDSEAYSSPAVDDRVQGEFYFGIGLFNEKGAPSKQLSNKPYIRVAHGWGTSSNMGDILLRWDIEKDPYNNQLSSVFYGHPVADSLLGFDLDIYLTTGIAHHYSSEVQSRSTEGVFAVKAYYDFLWPTKWRFGVAEGVSYIDNVTYLEETDNTGNGYESSKLMNYLDVSLDVNIGDLINKPDYNNLWLGYSLHHRSAIFETSSRFGRIKGGSNYNTIALTYEF
ncbi:MipA/OmpV family protein [Vibrio sp. HN007]